VELGAAMQILARRPLAMRPAWTRAQQTVLWHLVWQRGGDDMLKDFCGPKGQPDGEEPGADSAEGDE
jgi:hypothetical protein